MAHDFARLTELSNALYDRLVKHPLIRATIGEYRKVDHLPGIVSITVDNFDSEDLILQLDARGFEVSAGSACTSGNQDASHVLLAMGIPRNRALGSLRDPSSTITGVTCALDATLDNVRSAHKLGSNVLLTHHPVYIKAPDAFKPAESLTPSSSSVVYEAARLGVSVISMHTNLDRSAAARTLLPELMDFTASSSLEFMQQPDLLGLGAVADIAETNLASSIHSRVCGANRPIASQEWLFSVDHLAISENWRSGQTWMQLSAGRQAIISVRTSQYVALTYCCLAMTAQKSHSWKSWQKPHKKQGSRPLP